MLPPYLFAQVFQLLSAAPGPGWGRQQQLNIGQERPAPPQVPPQPLLHVEVAVADLGWGEEMSEPCWPLEPPSAPPATT